MSVDTEGRQPLLCMAREDGGEIDGARTLCAVEAPDALDRHRIHIHRLRAVAPAGRDRERDVHACTAELLRARRRLRDAADGRIGDDDLYGLAVRVAQILLKELLCRACHTHRLILECTAHIENTAPTVNRRTDADHRITANASCFCHDNFLHFALRFIMLMNILFSVYAYIIALKKCLLLCYTM